MKTISREIAIRFNRRKVAGTSQFVTIRASAEAAMAAGNEFVIHNEFRSLAAAQKAQKWVNGNCYPQDRVEIYELKAA